MPANTRQRKATAHQSIGWARSKAYLIPECRSSEDRARWRALASMKCESAVERSSLELGMTKMEPRRLAGKRKRAVSIFIPKALRRILVCSGYSRFGPPSNKNLFQKWLAAALVTSIPSGAQPHSEPAEVGALALSPGSVRMAKEIRKKDARSSLGIRILGGEKRVLAYTAALPKGTWRR